MNDSIKSVKLAVKKVKNTCIPVIQCPLIIDAPIPTNSKKRTYRIPVIIDTESEGVWETRNGHDYVLVTKKPIQGRYYLLSWLSRKEYERGTVLNAQVTIQYDYALVKIGREKGKIKDFHHKRQFTKL